MRRKKSEFSILPQRCSLVAETAESLRKGIYAGVWQELLPSERTLSEELQVSRSTLRTALKDLERGGWVKVKKRRWRIKKQSSKVDKDSGRRVVGVLSITSLTGLTPSVLLVLDTIRRTLSQVGFAMNVHVEKSCYSAKPARALEKLVKEYPSNVWVLLYSKGSMERWFVKNKLPCLVMGSSQADIQLPSIDADHRAVCHHAGALLLRKGHRQIALVLPREVFGGDADSETGLKELISNSGNACLQVLRHDGSADHICALLDESLKQKNPPTAFVVARATHTLTVFAHLLRLGKRIPEEVAVISRDDDPFMDAISPSITRYTNDANRYARRLSSAARQLAETGILPANAIRLMPKFLPGETV